MSHGDSKTGSFYPTSLGQNARYCKSELCPVWKSTKHKKGKKSTQSGASGGNHRGDRGHGISSKPSGKGKKLSFPQDTCYRCGKGRHQKTQDCKALDAVSRGCGKKGHFEKVCLKAKTFHTFT